jgi:hypothetical protein
VDDRGGVALGVFAFLTVLSFVGFILIARWRLAPGGRLIGTGLVLAILAAWYGLLNNLPPNRYEHDRPPYGSPAIAEFLARLAAVMILGGIVRGLLFRETAAAASTVSVPPLPPERARDVPPSV